MYHLVNIRDLNAVGIGLGRVVDRDLKYEVQGRMAQAAQALAMVSDWESHLSVEDAHAIWDRSREIEVYDLVQDKLNIIGDLSRDEDSPTIMGKMDQLGYHRGLAYAMTRQQRAWLLKNHDFNWKWAQDPSWKRRASKVQALLDFQDKWFQALLQGKKALKHMGRGTAPLKHLYQHRDLYGFYADGASVSKTVMRENAHWDEGSLICVGYTRQHGMFHVTYQDEYRGGYREWSETWLWNPRLGRWRLADHYHHNIDSKEVSNEAAAALG